MSNSKTTKRALVVSALAVLLCVTMLIGTTFAWFTDTKKTEVNTIKSGTLKLALEMVTGIDADGNETWGDATGTKLEFKKAAGHESEEILWEPGCTYELPKLRIRNDGTLALKYKVVITGIDGNAELNNVIDWTIDDTVVGTDILLKSGEQKEFTIKGHMQETASNHYQGMEITGISITVYATQATVEYDSERNTYDDNAEYATPVGTVDELTAAVNAGENVILTSDLSLTNALNVTKNIAIDLNGKTIASTETFAKVKDGTLTLTGGIVNSGNVAVRVEENGKAIINGGTYSAGTYTVYATKGGTVVINDGNFISQEFTCAVPNGGNVTINGGTFTAKDNCVIGTNGNDGFASSTITINGGTFNGNISSSGYIACGVYVANKDTVMINGGTFNITDGVGILMRAGSTTIGKDVVINLTNTGKVTAGKIGDATIDITTPSYLVVDVRSNYPASGTDFNVINNSSYSIVEYK